MSAKLRWFVSLVIVCCFLVLALHGTAVAEDWEWGGGGYCNVPELDPGTAASGLALLGGGLLLLVERFRAGGRKKQAKRDHPEGPTDTSVSQL